MRALKIEEYLGTLPEGILGGEDVQLGERSLREMFRLAGMGEGDVFYHLGCGDGAGVRMAVQEFGARAVGIDHDESKVRLARENVGGLGEIIHGDILDVDLGGATVILFWFADDGIIDGMMPRFEALPDGTRIITVWGPLPGCLPDKVDFPYIINRAPFAKSPDIKAQLQAVFGVDCVDFVTAWEFAERYTKALSSGTKNDRFLTIIQTLIIWSSAKRLGVACGTGVPESIRTYAGIMREHFGIDFGHLVE